MRRGTKQLVAALVAAMVPAHLALAAAKPVAVRPEPAAKHKDSDSLVVKYVSVEKGTAWGKPVLIVNVVPALGGNPMPLVVPKQNPTGNTFDPHPLIVNALKDVKPGDLFKVTTGKFMGHTLVQSMAPYKAKQGEDEPGAFIFVKAEDAKVDGADTLAVELRKFEVSQVALVPTIKDKSGKAARDAQIAAAVEKLKAGSVVEVDIEKVGGNFVIRGIRPFGDPVEAEFVKVADLGSGTPNLCVTVKRLGKTLVLSIPNTKEGTKMVPDARLAEQAKALKPGQAVMVKTVHVEGKAYLAEITPAEKPATQPAEGK